MAGEGPLVSIVIPCYNQIHYTYACLQSILEYTKDVTYEVIIADDVSTDATAEISRFCGRAGDLSQSDQSGLFKKLQPGGKGSQGQIYHVFK